MQSGYLYTTTQIKNIEQQCGVSERVLMDRAARALQLRLLLNWPGYNNVLIMAGPGNNGADGYTLAALLKRQGVQVSIVATEAQSEQAQLRKALCVAQGIPISARLPERMSFEVIVDALLGCGLSRTPQGVIAKWIDWINVQAQNRIPVLSVDVPSGLNADSGYAVKAVCATQTLTLIALKPGLFTGQAIRHCGTVRLHTLHLDDVDGPHRLASDGVLVSESEALKCLPPRQADAHKYQAGSVRVTGASTQMMGAALLAGQAAMRIGAGMVALNGSAGLSGVLSAQREELLLDSGGDRAYGVELIGPGLGRSAWSQRMFECSMNTTCAQVIDADGLYWLSHSPAADSSREQRVLTPHAKEAATLLHSTQNEVQRDRLTAARAISRRYGGVCVLKGPGTIVAQAQRLSIVNRHHPGMATAGMGDVLSGVIAGLMAQGSSAWHAAVAGVWLHGQAAVAQASERGSLGQMSADLLPYLQSEMNALRSREPY